MAFFGYPQTVKSFFPSWFSIFLVYSFAAPAGGQVLLPEEVVRFADVILYNGKVLTVDRDGPEFEIAEAVAIRDGKFLAVGDSTRIQRMAGPQTRKIDLQGKTVVPGFVNSGSNAFAAGDWSKTTQVGSQIVQESESEGGPPSMQNIVASIRSLAARAQPGDLIYFAAPDAYPAELRAWTFRDLDNVVSGNPMAIVMGGSNVVANSAMMKLAFSNGLSRESFCVIKDNGGNPTGQFCQKAAGFILGELRPWPDRQTLESMTERFKKRLAVRSRVGITSQIGWSTALDFLIAQSLYRKNELTSRLYMTVDLRTDAQLDSLLKRIGNIVDFALGDRVHIVGANIRGMDTSPDSPDNILSDAPRRRVATISDLPGDPKRMGENQMVSTTWTGKTWEGLTPEERRQTEWGTIMEAGRLGWNFVAVHNQGARARETFLEIFEASDGQPDILLPRFHPQALDRNVQWNSELIARAAQLKDRFRFGLNNVFFDPRPRRDLLVEQWGERVHSMQPAKDLLDARVPIHLEMGENRTRMPLAVIEQVVTRKDEKGTVWGAQQAIDRKTALLLCTRRAANFIDRSQTIGSIEQGKLADLVVLGGDFLAVPDDQIAAIPVEMTMIGGAVVYERTKL
jgi:predicted amidohydrolase YtcJ